MDDVSRLQRVDIPHDFKEHVARPAAGSRMLCIARSANPEKAEQVLLLAITGDCNIAKSKVTVLPATDSKASLRAMSTIRDLHQSRRAFGEAANTHRNSIQILQALERPR